MGWIHTRATNRVRSSPLFCLFLVVEQDHKEEKVGAEDRIENYYFFSVHSDIHSFSLVLGKSPSIKKNNIWKGNSRKDNNNILHSIFLLVIRRWWWKCYWVKAQDGKGNEMNGNGKKVSEPFLLFLGLMEISR